MFSCILFTMVLSSRARCRICYPPNVLSTCFLVSIIRLFPLNIHLNQLHTATLMYFILHKTCNEKVCKKVSNFKITLSLDAYNLNLSSKELEEINY